MPVPLHIVVVEIERAQRLHVHHAERGLRCIALVIPPAAAVDFAPRLRSPAAAMVWSGSPRKPHRIQLPHGGRGSGRSVRPDRNLHGLTAQRREPLLRDSHFRRRTAPKQIRWCRGNDQEVRPETHPREASASSIFRSVGLRIDEQRLVPGFRDFVERKQQLQRIVRILAAKVGRTLGNPSSD